MTNFHASDRRSHDLSQATRAFRSLRFLAALKVGQYPSAYAVTAIVYVMPKQKQLAAICESSESLHKRAVTI
jgi:hypothetical protein